MMRGGQYNTYVFRCPTEGSSRTPTPTVGCVTDVSATNYFAAGFSARLAGCTNQTAPNYTRRTNSDRLHPRAPIRPRVKKVLKGVKAPHRIAEHRRTGDGAPYGGQPFYPFTPFYYRVRVWAPPITSEKPPGTSPGGLRYLIAQREVSHCPRRHAAQRAQPALKQGEEYRG